MKKPLVRSLWLALFASICPSTLFANDFETSFEVLAPSGEDFYLEMAHYTGGNASTPASASLARTGIRSWLVEPGETGLVQLFVPAETISFYVRHEDPLTTSFVTIEDENGNVLVAGLGDSDAWYSVGVSGVTAERAVIKIFNSGSVGRVAVDDVFYSAPGPGTSFCSGDGSAGPGCAECPCGNNAPPGTVGGCMNPGGHSARLIALGSASISAGTLEFRMSGGYPFSFGMLLGAENALPSSASNPCPAGSGVLQSIFSGLRCVGGNARRFGPRPIAAGGLVGVGRIGIQTTQPWPSFAAPTSLATQGGYMAGQTRHFQVVYREFDLSCPFGQNTSNAYTVTFEL